MTGSYTPETEEHEAIIEREWYRQGYVFKDEDAYEEDKDKVCYVPELCDDAYTGNDFLRLCEEQDIADLVFETVDWQSPETYFDELDTNEEIDRCDHCGRLFLCYGQTKCYRCGAPYKKGNE